MSDSPEVRLARLEGAIAADPSVPNFFAEKRWRPVRQDIVARGREEEFIEQCHSIYGSGDRSNGDHRDDPPPGYIGDADELF